MQQHSNVNRNVKAAVLLGLLTLVSNFVIYTYFPAYFIRLGNIFVFMSASALGMSGGLLSFAVGIATDSLHTAESLGFLRLLILTTAIGWTGKRYPRIPSFLVPLAAWAVLFGPLVACLRYVGIPTERWVSDYVFVTALGDVLLTMMGGVLLYNSDIWTALTKRPRPLAIGGLLIHIVASLCTIAIFAVISTSTGSSITQPGMYASNLGGIICIAFFGIILPSLLAWRFSELMAKNYHEMFSAGLMPNTNKTFSGLASDYWRRNSSTNLMEDPLQGQRAASRTTPSSEDNGTAISPHQGICALNRNGTITFVNRKFRKLAEVRTNDVIGMNISAVGMNAAVCKHIVELVEQTFEKGPRATELKVNEMPNLRFLEISSHRSDSFEGSSLSDGPDSIIVTIKDITERRTVESHLLQAQKLNSLGSLVEGVAHSFNNSLTTITGQASFAKRCSDPRAVERALDEVLKSAFNAGTMVRQLLDFAHGGPGLMRKTDLTKAVAERIVLLKPVVGENCSIAFEHDDKAIGVECDSNLLTQALTNLVLNAREAYPDENGSITVQLGIEEIAEEVAELNVGSRAGTFARLRVIDQGRGMTAETMAKAFEPLFTTKASSGHPGLGLSIVFAIVRAHDGFLTVESHPEKGTTFSIYLPLADLTKSVDTTDEEKQNTRGTSDMQGNREKILVVEDEQSIRELLSTMLTSLNYTVTVCGDGEEALDTAKRSQFDLVLVDWIIPKIKGTELIERLRQEKAGTKALLMTGYGANATAQNVDFLYKPFDMEGLAHAVRKQLNG